MGETYHCHFSLEDGAGGGPDCEACWRDGSKVDYRSGKSGTVSRYQAKIVRIELMSRRVKMETNPAGKTQSQGSTFRKKRGMAMPQ